MSSKTEILCQRIARIMHGVTCVRDVISRMWRHWHPNHRAQSPEYAKFRIWISDHYWPRYGHFCKNKSNPDRIAVCHYFFSRGAVKLCKKLRAIIFFTKMGVEAGSILFFFFLGVEAGGLRKGKLLFIDSKSGGTRIILMLARGGHFFNLMCKKG